MIIQEYANFFEQINENTSIKEYKIFFDENSNFKDPFHEVKGIDKIYPIFTKMYENLDTPKFKVNEIISKDNISYINWTFSFYFKNSKEKQSFEGVSKVAIKNEKVLSHIDYWDAAANLYEKLPLVKHLIKFLRKKVSS